MPSFSISVPVGAYHDLLPVCLTSLAAQRGDLRVSLLDASGDPRVGEVAGRFGALFSYRRHGPDKGQSDAIAEGWAQAPGDVLGWLNADDFLYPGAIERVEAAFERNPSTDVVSGHSAICDRRGALTGYHWAVEPPGKALLSGCVISQPSCFFRKPIYDAVGGLDRSLHYTMDWDLWLRFFRRGAEFEFLNEPLSAVYWGKGTKTVGMNRERRLELERLINTYTPANERFRTRRGFLLRAALDNIKAPRLKHAIEDRLRRNKPAIFGIGPNGVLGEASTIYWPHFGIDGSAALALNIDGLDHVEASSDRACSISREGAAIIMRFDKLPLQPCVIDVALHRRSSARARLISCGAA